MYPAGGPPKAEAWTWDTMLKAAEACHKAGFPFGIGLGHTADSVDTVGRDLPVVRRQPGRRQGQHHGQDPTPSRQALDYCKKLAQFLPPDAPAWDDASNNKWLISGKGALIMNPPSAWAVAKRDAPQGRRAAAGPTASPSGPKGRYAPFLPYFWGIWNFSKNKAAAKSLLVHLSQRASVEKMVAASGGYDLPVVRELRRLQDLGRGRAAQGHALPLPEPAQSSDPVDRRARRRRRTIAQQIYTQAIQTKMIVRFTQGETDGQDPRLGRKRARRLHADLMRSRCAAAAHGEHARRARQRAPPPVHPLPLI